MKAKDLPDGLYDDYIRCSDAVDAILNPLFESSSHGAEIAMGILIGKVAEMIAQTPSEAHNKIVQEVVVVLLANIDNLLSTPE